MTKVALVTGASRGIGAEISRQLAQNDWQVCINHSNSQEQADKVVEQISSFGGKAIAYQADVSKEEDVKKMFDFIDDNLGTVTGLVNNAGINGAGVRMDEATSEDLKKLIDVNVLGSFLCAKYAIQRMAKRYGGTGGSIVNISSAASRHGGPGYIDYAASKGALDTFTIGLAKEQADQHIRVNCLRPGATMTELSVEFAKENPEWLAWVMKQVPLGRPGEEPEIANAAVFLLSENASYITGAILDASGGWVSP